MAQLAPKPHILKDGQLVSVRTCLESDARRLMECAEEYLLDGEGQVWEAGELELTQEREIEWIRQKLACPRDILIVAEHNGKIVANIDFTSGTRRRLAHIGEIGMAVLPAWRNKGLGKILMKTLIDWAKHETYLEKLNLRVLSTNERAIALYEGFGFSEEGRRMKEIKYSDGRYADCILMTLFLR